MPTSDRYRAAKRGRRSRPAVSVFARAAAAGWPCGWALRDLRKSVVEDVAQVTADILIRLAPVSKSMEGRFLDCGKALEELTSSTDALMADSADLIRLASGREDAEQIIGETVDVLSEPLGYLDQCTEAVQAQVGSLEVCSQAMARLLAWESALQLAVAPLNLSQTMFRIEAARLPEEPREYFRSLSDQIGQLHLQVCETFREEFRGLSVARATLEALIVRLRTEAQREREVLDTERKNIEDTFQRLSKEIENNRQRDVQLTSKSRTVAAAASRIVMALQSQDIVAQRLEHVFEGLREAQAIGSRLRMSSEDGQAFEGMAQMHGLLEVQSAQLTGVRSEIASSSEKVQAAASELLSTVEALDHECVFLNDFTEVTAAANGTIQVLLEMVGTVRQLVSSVVVLVGDARERILPIGAVTGQLTGSVEAISLKMNQVALNAQIQAVQIGAGTGLEVLAAHTAGIATETARVGTNITADLGELREQMEAQLAALAEQSRHGQRLMEYMDRDGRDQEGKLHQARDRVLTKLDMVGKAVQAVRHAGARILQSAALEERDERPLAEVLDRLEGTLGLLSEILPVLGHRRDAGELAGRGYTMAAERHTHRAVVAGWESGLAEGEAMAVPVPAAHGADVELF